VRPSVSAAMDFRNLLGYSGDTLVRGLMLLTPGQRARLRLALEEADSPGTEQGGPMSLMSTVEQAVEKVFHEVEARVETFDAQAVAEARAVVAQAKAAESEVLVLAKNYKAEIVALAKQYGPEVVAALEADADKLAASLKELFEIA
jgi:hypothetical protein